MKNYCFLLLVISVFSCTTSESATLEMEEENLITAFLEKRVAPNGTILDSVYYTLNNDKIVDYSGYIFYNGAYRDVNRTYSFSNENLIETNSYIDGELDQSNTYAYNTDGDINEVYKTLFFNNAPSYDRYVYTYTSDTIYRTRYRSYDDGATEDIVSESKYVFDISNNLTYYDIYSYSNFLLTKIYMDYDANDNMLLESRILDYPYIQLYTNTFTYDINSLNTLFEINKNTFGKRNYILFHYFDLTDAYWNINPKNICKNSMAGYDSTYEDPIVYTFELSNELNENGYAQKNTYKYFVLGDFYFDNVIEYFFE